MEGQASHRFAAMLAHRISGDVEAGSASSAITSLCEDMSAALTPIVGARGVAALYKRSLFLSSREHPVLSGLHEGGETIIDFSRLTARLTLLSETEAANVGATLLQSFYELLSSLVGPSLTERLLRSSWDRPLSDPPAPETTA